MSRLVTLRGVVAGVVIGALVAGGVAAASVSFDDVPSGKFYEAPAEWAKANGITTGSPAGSRTFKPEDPVTRGESVTFLKRYDDNVVQPALADRYTKTETDALVAGVPTMLYAKVAADGTLTDGSAGVSMESKGSAGVYGVQFGTDITGCVWQATLAFVGSGGPFIVPSPADAEISIRGDIDVTPFPFTTSVLDPEGIWVETRDSDGTLADHDFYLTVLCP